MKIHETLDRDPRQHALANSGQARITSEKDERAMQELRAELETFVCDGQYGDAIEIILKSYLNNLDRPKQDAAWVSGFFGSGKSHLLKMLGHLWVDTPFSDGATARSLVHGLPDEVVASDAHHVALADVLKAVEDVGHTQGHRGFTGPRVARERHV